MSRPSYLWRVAIAADKFANTILGGNPAETISARLGHWQRRPDRGIRRRVAALLCGVLDAIDPGHCYRTQDALTKSGPLAPLLEYPYHGTNTNGEH